MLLLASNIKYLRKSKKVTQQDIGAAVGVSDNAISNYENGKFFPTADVLVKICEFFNVSSDDLLLRDLSSGERPNEFEPAVLPASIKGTNIMVPVSAQAGYALEWSQEFIRSLTFVAIPGVEGEARTFEIAGNSMSPVLLAGEFVSCIPVADVTKIENNRIYAIVGRESGIHVKYLQPEDQRVLCIPANRDEFEPYYLEADDIREIWEARVKVTSRIVDQLAGSSGNTDKKLRSLEEFLKGKFPDLIVTE
jgi:transcriptional regulator with XRE-family HTH domain